MFSLLQRYVTNYFWRLLTLNVVFLEKQETYSLLNDASFSTFTSKLLNYLCQQIIKYQVSKNTWFCFEFFSESNEILIFTWALIIDQFWRKRDQKKLYWMDQMFSKEFLKNVLFNVNSNPSKIHSLYAWSLVDEFLMVL